MDKRYFDKCKKRIQMLVDRALRVNATFGILRQIQTLQFEENDIINKSHTFYKVVIINFIENLFIEINKLFETGSENESVIILLEDIKHNYDKLGDKVFSSNVFKNIYEKTVLATN